MKGDMLTVKAISAYYNEAHFLRPLRPGTVEEYAELMKDGNVFPRLVLGTYTGQDNKPGMLIVDGVLRFRAAQDAGVKKLACEIRTYSSLAEALADQLKLNLAHGLKVTADQRDIRIRMLREVYGWSLAVIASAVGLHYSSISRIAAPEKKQNLSGTGKPGPKGPNGDTSVMAHALPPKTFFRSIENIHTTISKVRSKKAILFAIQDPKVVKDKAKTITLLRRVIDEFQQLLKAAEKLADLTKEEGEKKAA